MAIKHVKVVTTPDDGTSEVGTDEWNDDHTIDDNTITDDMVVAHTTTKITVPVSKITDFDTEVANNSAVTANTAKITNATHTGDVTGSGALTISNGAVDLAHLSASGTKDSSTYLRGDNAWAQVSGIPSGVILMWSGSLASIPAGWNLCDGNNGTPNLIAKFVRSISTASTETGTTGGSDAVTLTGAESGLQAHGHTGSTNSTGSHNHALGQTTNSNAQGGNKYYNTATYGRVDLGKYTESNGTHSHTVTVNNASAQDASSSHENRPAFYELAYIMKA